MKDKTNKSSGKEEVLNIKYNSKKKNQQYSSSTKKKKRTKKDSFIPKNVANRMARRVAFTTGIPTILGMGVFVLSYFLITKGITDVSPSLTLATSAIFFLLGLLGLSYGILSASWEKEPGGLVGLKNINPNIQKMRSAFKSAEDSKT